MGPLRGDLQRIRRLLVLGVLAACGPRAARPAPPAAGTEVTLYRDRTVIRQRLDVVVPASKRAQLTLRVPAGVELEDIVVLDHGELVVAQTASSAAAAASRAEDERNARELGDARPARPPTPAAPTTITIAVTAPRPGRYALSLGYVTDRLSWDAAYTMTTTAARTHATLRGAIAIRNVTGLAIAGALTHVVDGDLGVWRGRIAEQTGTAVKRDAHRDTPLTLPRTLGVLELVEGETRVELLAGEAPRPVRPVLVYDPIGTRLDHVGTTPIRDAKLGADDAGARVTESLEVARPRASSEGLPGGPVRLLERRADGSLALLGEARLFDVATAVATADIVELGTADGVRGRRDRREFSLDDDRKRLTEEFALTIENTRPQPVEVVLREHLYRSLNWALAYDSGDAARKDGAQQISMRLRVPAKGEAKLFYVVVYTWP